MRRLAIALAVVAVVLVPPAVAAQEAPQATFSSPPRAVAGAPMYLRSITPCPLIAGAYQFVRAGITEHGKPHTAYIESTDADLRADGSWEVTISAPVDMPSGITRSYDVKAQCGMNTDPYRVPDDASDEDEDDDPEISLQDYVIRPLRVTGFGSSEVTDGDGPSGSTTTSAVTTSTTGTTVVAASATKASASSPSTSAAAKQVLVVDDSAARIAAARAELAAGGLDASTMTDAEVLASATSDVAPPVDGGIPWWAFALAAVLAVSAVVAFGVRRTSLVAELDRETSGD